MIDYVDYKNCVRIKFLDFFWSDFLFQTDRKLGMSIEIVTIE